MARRNSTEKTVTRSTPAVPSPNLPVALPWGDGEIPRLAPRNTREGLMFFREIPIPTYADAKWIPIWQKHKREFIERGWGVRQYNGQWFLQQWLQQDGAQWFLSPIGAERLAGMGKRASEPKQAPLELVPLPPAIEAKLFDYQVEPARQIYRALREGENEWGFPGAWDASDLGTGKTYQALAAAAAFSWDTGREIGVVCPLSVIPAWHGAFRHFGIDSLFVINYEKLRTGNQRHIVRLEKTETGKRFAWNRAVESSVVLMDEAHKCKSDGSKQQALMLALVRQKIPTIAISGTIATTPVEMRATGRLVGLHTGGGDFMRFLSHSGCRQYEGKWYLPKSKIGALRRIHTTIFPRRGARTRIEDLGDRFPETQIITEAYDAGANTAAIAAAFDEVTNTIARLVAQGEPEGRIKAMEASAYMKAWHDSERLKAPMLVDLVKAEIENGRSVAVFCNFIDTRQALMDGLKTQCAIYGGQKPADRERCIADFQADRSNVIVANIDAGGVGVSLHDVRGERPRTAVILPTNKVVSLTQALGRVHRAGGKSKSRQLIIFAAGTIEEQICASIRSKMGNLAALNDGDLNPSNLPEFK